MAFKLYVGNLPYSTTDEELSTMFAEFGAVESSQVIKDRFSGRSKGFGFVEMSSDEEGQKAIDAMDGKEVGGRTVKVNKARPLETRPTNGQ